MRWTASSLPTVRHCGYAGKLSKSKKRDRRQQASLDKGSAFHSAAEAWARTGERVAEADEEVDGWLTLLYERFTLPPQPQPELPLGLSLAGHHVPVTEPEPHQYRPVDPHYGGMLLTAGRADLCWTHEETACVVDHKTGRFAVSPAGNLQLLALGFSYAHRAGAPYLATGIWHARQGRLEWADTLDLGSSAAADAFAEVKAAALQDETPRPGPHCERCWERKRCESYLAEHPELVERPRRKAA